MLSKEQVDWSECPLVEIKPRVQSGAPVLRGTRMPADAIVHNFAYGVSVDEIAEQFEISPDCVEAVLAYAKSERCASCSIKTFRRVSERFLVPHEVHTFVAMHWPDQLENGQLLKSAEESGFHVLITSDQNIRYQQNLGGRKLALVVLGSNIWPIVREYDDAIAAAVDGATPGSYCFIEMPVPPKPRRS